MLRRVKCVKAKRRGLQLPTAWGVLVGMLIAACSSATGAPDQAAAPAPGAAAPLAASAAAAAAGPSADTAAPATPPQRASLRVAVQGRPDQAHLQLALDRGYFTAQGLDVETVQITSGAEMVP